MMVFGMGSKDFAWEVSFFRKMSQFRQQLNFIDLKCGLVYEKEWDHSPRFEFYFELFNYKILEISVHNIHHAPETHLELTPSVLESDKD